jgi:hypothetical protein
MRALVLASGFYVFGCWFAPAQADVGPVPEGTDPGAATSSELQRLPSHEENPHYIRQKQALIAYVECMQTAHRSGKVPSDSNACIAERTDYAALLPEGMQEKIVQGVDYQVAREFAQ